MTRDIYRYVFAPGALIEEIEDAILLAALSVESLYGEAQARLDVAHYLDPQARACVVDASTRAGRDFNKLLCGLLTREFGPASFTVERVTDKPVHRPETAASNT